MSKSSLTAIRTAETKLLDGIMYKVNPETKTVKRIEQPIKFNCNKSIEALTNELSADNTKVLYEFLKAYYPDAALLNGFVRVNGVKIKYHSHGFKLVSTDGTVKNINQYNNDFPTPEAVLAYFNKTEEAVKKLPTVNREEAERGKLHKMAAVESIKVEVEKVAEKSRLLVELTAIINKFTDKKQTYRETLAKLNKRAAEPLYKKIIPVFDLFRTNKINQRTFWKKFNTEISDYEEQKRKQIEENKAPLLKPKPVKFEGVPLWEPIQPSFTYEEYRLKVTEDGEFEIVDEVLKLSFKLRGPSGRVVEMSHTVEAYYANVVLHYYPKALALLNKVARGDVKNVNTWKLGKHYIVDALEAYTPALYENPIDRYEFCRVCREVLAYEGVTTMFDWVYSDEFTKGQKIRVFIPLQGTWDAVVIGTETGVELRYEDGTTAKLLKEQKVFA